MREERSCSVCGAAQEDLEAFEGQMLCPSCLEDRTCLCQRCGQRFWKDQNAGDEEQPLCPECFEMYYTTCSECGTVLPLGEAYYDDDGDRELCWACYNQSHQERAIQDYYYKPEPVFYGEGNRFFGVELEVDQGGELNRNARRLLEIANQGEDRLYIKHDGSLGEGFELVSHPMTLDYHCREMPWPGLLQASREMGYRSHQASTCGLHVHVNREAFGETEREQEACIARILYFFERNWEELLKFSRRTRRQLERWADRYGYKEQPREILDHAKKGGHGGRYSCVNLQNEATVEFRIFRGTLKWNTFVATLQLVNRVCDVALYLSDQELKAMTWSSFAAGCQEPELVQYLKERRLYVNEPIESEEEV